MVEHILLAVMIQTSLGALLRNWTAGAAAACSWAIAREITQAEYRWIEWFGDGRRANMPWWGGLDLRVWQRADPWLDWTLPCAIAVIIAVIMNRGRRGVHQPDRRR